MPPTSSRWGIARPDPRPFAKTDRAFVLTPVAEGPDREAVKNFITLIEREQAELATELGCSLTFGAPPADGALLAQCLIGPASMNPDLREVRRSLRVPDPGEAHVWIDRDRRTVVIDGPGIEAIGAAFQFLRTAIRSGTSLTTSASPVNPAQVVGSIRAEVATTYPAFALRSIDWGEILARHHDPIMASGASLPALQRLFAELGDAHTWVRGAHINGRWPYRVWADRASATLTDVPVWSAGWDAGARPSDHVLDVDTHDWWSRTSATSRTRPMVAGYRMMAGRVTAERTFRVRKASGDIITWTEGCPAFPWQEPVSWHGRPSGTGYLAIRGWLTGSEWCDSIDTALTELALCPRLIVDLRGNVGGSLIAAQAFRDRFLTGVTNLGSIRFSRGDGTLGGPSRILGEPPANGSHWTRPVRFLIDRQTYSASEDAILGLQGLPHVQVAGEPSGGGSGRPRTFPLMHGMSASVSTALTFDRHGRCIEGAGIPVDLALPVLTSLRQPTRISPEAILSTADTGW